MTARRRRGVLAAATVTVALVALASCGLRSEGDANAINADDVPFGLLETSSTTAGATTSQPPSRTMEVYMVQSGKLFPVAREVEVPTVAEALDALREGPTPSEARDGARTALPPDVVIESVNSDGSMVVVDLSGPFSEATPREQTLALAQMVYTATAFPGVESMRVLLEGERIEVPRADGTLTTSALRRADYESLR